MNLQRVALRFERYNSKYNRIWEQLTTIGIFVFTLVSVYLVAVASFERNIDTFLTLDILGYFFLGIIALMGVVSSILIVHLLRARNDLHWIFHEAGI